MSEKRSFDLASVLKDVSGLDTSADGRERIEYIDIDRIDPDPNNFYEMSDMDSLVANIELIGLQQPLRVRSHPDDPDRVMIVSGHRRREALSRLVKEGREDLRQVACIKDTKTESNALRELRLIYANSDTRKLSSVDIQKQVSRVKALLYQLKEEGYEFPGRMRDHVAEACKVSKTKIARLEMIQENLASCWEDLYNEGKFLETNAYAMARLPGDHQRAIYQYWIGYCKPIGQLYEGLIVTYGKRLEELDKLQCKKGNGSCTNIQGKTEKVLRASQWQTVTCTTKCCAKCSDLAKCKYACPKLADKVKKLKADAKEQRKQEALEKEAADRPKINLIQALWNRFGEARNASGASIEDAYKALGRYYYASEDEKIIRCECLEEKFTPDTYLPYGYGCRLPEIEKFIKLADLFNCSLDYLLCRTDNPRGVSAPGKAAAAQQVEITVIPGMWYPRSVQPPIGSRIVVIALDGFAEDAEFDGQGLVGLAVTPWKEVALWCLAPQASADRAPAPDWLPLKWISGKEKPAKPMEAMVKFSLDSQTDPIKKIAVWNGSEWCSRSGYKIEMEPVGWFPMPVDTEDEGGK